MNTFSALRSLGPIDVRSVRRDSMLAWIIFIPIMTALLLRLLVPWLTERLLELYQFDLVPYYPVILSYFFIMMAPVTFGVIIGFLLLDERDSNTLLALQVSPLPLNGYLAYRIIVPMILTVILMFIVFPLANLGSLDFWQLLVVAIVASPLAPLYALFLATFAENKVQGFAVMKASGFILLFIPLIAFFIDSGWRWLFGIIPTFWPMLVFWMIDAGDPGVWLPIIIALVYQFVLKIILLKRFNQLAYR